MKSEAEPEKLSYEPFLDDPLILFMRGYPNRLPDWLVYNQETNAVRRFVEVSSNEVMEELLGGNRAPGQEDLKERWGKAGEDDDLRSQMRERFEEQQTEPYRAPDIAEIIKQAQFPVYGLVGGTLGLTLGPLCHGGSPAESVQLGFIRPSSIHEDIEIAVWIESKVRRYRVISQEARVKEWEARSAAQMLWGNSAPQRVREEWFRDRRRLRNILADLGGESRATLACSIPDFPADVAALSWMDVRPAFAFLLENESTVLVIATLGLSKQEVEDLTGTITPVNHRADVLSDYQAALDTRHQEIEQQAADVGSVQVILENGEFIDSDEDEPI